MLPIGFTGSVDDLGRFYTNDGKIIEGVPSAVNFPAVEMNPNYGKTGGGDCVFMAKRPDGTPGPYFYTSDFKKGQSAAKFAKVEGLTKKIESIRKRWLAHVKNFDPVTPESVACTILEILYAFSARVGSVGNAAGGTSTYGVSTLLVKHATITPDGNITLRYKGKDGVPTTHKITHTTQEGKWLIHNLNELMADKGPKDRIFTIRKGNRQLPVTAAIVNQEFRKCGAPEGVTVHKLRTVKGTAVFSELMAQALAEGKKRPKDERAALELFKKMAEAVGKALNHVRNTAGGAKVTGATAIQAYIDPQVQIAFFEACGFRVPKFLEKHAGVE
jgi:DNA topoisomerase IB